MKKLLILIFTILVLANSVSATNLFTCRTSSSITASNICNADEESVFYLNKNFYQPSNPASILSSKVSLTFNTNTYNKAICCKVTNPDLGQVKFDSTILSNQICPPASKELLYFTNTTNAKIGYPESANFNKLNYTNKLCVKVPTQFSSLDIIVNESDYSYAGYTCLFKTNQLQNSYVSSCNATFNGNNFYKYTVWARLFEDTSSLKCNNDCTSKLDNRVYSSCGSKILACRGIPKACDGAILGSTVKLDNIRDVKCSAPWNEFKFNTFTNETINIKTIDENKCLNLIKKKYSVILNNELVTMSIYTCNN